MDAREQTFNDYRYIAKQVAMYYARRYARAMHETLDHAEFALALLICDAAGKYDPERGPIEAWLRFKMTMHLKDVYLRGYHPHCSDIREPRKQREQAHTDLLEILDETTELTRPLPSKPECNWIGHLLAEMGEEACALLEIVCDTPHDLLNEICSQPGRTGDRKRQNLVDYLINILDWSEWEVRQAFTEVERCLCR